MNEQSSSSPELEVMALSALEAMERANVDMLVKTAKAYPRDIAKSKRQALALVTMDPETAGECFYKFDRGGKTIQGPSVRLAEIIASTWGNIRAGSRTIQETATTVVAQGFCHDLEQNVFIAREVERKVVNKMGQKFNEDMVIMTKNANAAIALRNSVFACIPRAYINNIYEEAIRAAVGDIKTLSERVTKALSKFASMGVVNEKVLQKLGVQRVDEITVQHLETMFGLFTAINDKEITVDEAFPPLVKKGTAGASPDPSSQVSSTTTSTPPAEAAAFPDPHAEIERRCGTDGVTLDQVLLYAKDRKMATKQQEELRQLSNEKLNLLLSTWKNILPNIRSMKAE